MQVITIVGPTASGKTSLSTKIAALIGGEIISADSRQVYRGMDLGSGKDLREYVVNGIQIPYHLIDIREPGYEYSVFEFQKDFLSAFRNIVGRENIPILCGGTGMYLESAILAYNLAEVPMDSNLREFLSSKPTNELKEILMMYGKLHNSTDLVDRERIIRAIEIKRHYEVHPEEAFEFPKLKYLVMGLSMETEALQQRIRKRLKHRLSKGMVEEVKALLDGGITPPQLIQYGLEYKYITLYIMGELNANDMFQKLNAAIGQFAKRQMTWFRRMEKNGVRIHWINAELPEEEQVIRAMTILRNHA